MKRFLAPFKVLRLALLAVATGATLAYGQPSNPGIQRFGAVTAGNCVEWLNNFQVQDAGFACSGLAPAGASGTLQYNNAGAFGGVSGWTTNGTTTLIGSTTALLSWNSDLFLTRDAANTLAQRNGTNAQVLNLYKTFTDTLNYARLRFDIGAADSASLAIYGQSAGTGTFTNVDIGFSNAKLLRFSTSEAGLYGIPLNIAPLGINLTDGQQVLKVTATQPASPTNLQDAVKFTITSAGSASQVNRALYVSYAAGYTGSSTTVAISADNSLAGTGATLVPAAGTNFSVGNFGLVSITNATTTGYNFGGAYYAYGGNVNVGIAGFSQVAKNSATNIGVVGSAINTGTSPVQIGGFFSLNQTTVPTVSAALIADNGSQTSAIFLARDNGSTVFTIADGGNVTSTGVIRADTGFNANGTAGASATLSVRKGDDSGACDLVFTSGLFTSTTC
jgi:hypothetical protein